MMDDFDVVTGPSGKPPAMGYVPMNPILPKLPPPASEETPEPPAERTPES